MPVSAETARAEQNVGSGSAGRTVIVEAPVDVVSPLLERLLAEHFGAVTRSGAMEMRCTRPGAVFTGRVHATLFGTSTTTIDLRTRSELAGWFKVGVRLVLVPALGFAGLYVSFLAELNPVATGVGLPAPGAADTPDYGIHIPIPAGAGKYLRLQPERNWTIDGHTALAQAQVLGY